jgi:Rps23 Pro-64 3,4-dihydroxylase Tpa1-like proline 4-hydroxylase
MKQDKYSQSQLKKFAHDCAYKISNAVDEQSFFEAPFKHIVLDNFLPNSLALLASSTFPNVNNNDWEIVDDQDIEVKLRSNWKSEFDIPDGLIDTIRILNSAPVLKAMGERMKIPKLISDPYFTGGGLNITKRGGLLDVHVDGNYHDATGLNRRTNLLIYLNEQWEDDWGGEFGLYDHEGKVCLKKVAPIFNRCVIFDTHDYSFHGLPDPINFPENVERKSILLYFYTVAPRESSQINTKEPHSALWVKRNLNDKYGNKTRKFT